MDVFPTASAIKTMEIRGAGRIARAASSALSMFAEGYEGSDLQEFMDRVEEQRRILLDSRPTAVSLYNGVSLTLKGVKRCRSVEEAKEKIIGNSSGFIDSSFKAVSKIAETGASLIRDGDVILTHCNSSTAVNVITKAHSEGKRFKVYATESRPWGQGFITVTELAKSGVDITLIIDSAVTSVMGQVTKIFVGADTITPRGDLYNKIGTAQIATVASTMGKPVYVCAETYKILPTYRDSDVRIEERDCKEVIGERKLPDNVKIFNPVFDRTESKYIRSIITEEGIIDPKDIEKLSLRIFGNKEE